MLPNPDTNGAEESVIVSEVSSFQRLKCMQEWYILGVGKGVLFREVSSVQECPHRERGSMCTLLTHPFRFFKSLSYFHEFSKVEESPGVTRGDGHRRSIELLRIFVTSVHRKLDSEIRQHYSTRRVVLYAGSVYGHP